MELDKYETNLAEMSRMYGQKFYEYHKIFSQRCAAALAVGKKINWAEKDKDLLQMIIGGTPANVCGMCGEVSHTTPFCPRHMHPSITSLRIVMAHSKTMRVCTMVFLYVITLTLVDVKETSIFMLIFVKSANLHHMVPEAVQEIATNRFWFRCLTSLLSQNRVQRTIDYP